MLVRLGVKLSPKQADFFDMIERVSRAGSRISVDALADVFYPTLSRSQGKRNVKQHICQMNKLLEETDYTIKCLRDEGYRLMHIIHGR